MIRRIAVPALAGILLTGLVLAAPASAAGVAWTVRSVAEPSNFSADDAQTCATLIECNNFALLVTNASDQPSSETDPLILTDTLPKGLKPLHPSFLSGHDAAGQEWACLESERSSEVWTENCEYLGLVLPGAYAPSLTIRVTPPGPSMAGVLVNEVAVTGGGSSRLASTTEETPISDAPPPFGLSHFAFESLSPDGLPEDQAGAHPWEATTSFTTPLTFAPSGAGLNAFQTVENIRDTGLELPAGFIGDPRATPRCTLVEFANHSCPAGSEVGAFAVVAGAFGSGEFQFTGAAGLVAPFGCCSTVYNIVPEAGYPAEFAFEFASQAVLLYAGVIHSRAGYRLRVISPGIPAILETSTAVITFFGNPSSVDKSGGGGSPFLSNPSDCSAGALGSRIEQDSWEHPESFVGAETTAYPQLTGCSALEFHPSLVLHPDTASADSPAGLDVDLQVPQTSGIEELATPPLKTATVQLPEGLVVNPSAASGLEGCESTGPKGINIGSASIGAKGQDLGNPEATELGEGHVGPGGNSSLYDDGFWHTAPGHCPAASTLGTVEATTPLLPEPIKGQIFLGTPDCAPCSAADAESGKLLKLYLEINDPKTGTILKLPGTVSAAATGRLTASFRENPQLPVEDLKLRFFSGPRAALTSPQTCGEYSTSSSLEPWSAPETPTAVSNSSFDISSGPQGCGAPPNKPKFEAGTTSTQAGAFAPFVLKLSREDGTQRLKALNVTLPPGLTGKLAGVQECSPAAITAAEGMGGKAEQASPSCPLASELGTVNVGAGSGPDPYYVQGHAYLAGPYKGAPLSMAIITPAVAGPFDLGTVVVRAALFVDPFSAQITVKSDPLPQIVSGVPLDVRSIAVNISRNQFTLNPTSCNPMTLAANIVASASEAAVSSPFQVGGCSALAFKPKVAIQLKGGTRRTKNPALTATVTYPPGSGYANIARAQVTLPHSEFLEQSHIRTVCTRVQFAAGAGNGSGCPKGSVYGFARAVTPLLDKPLEGPVYLRSSSHKLPDLVAALGGQINVDLDGKIDTGKGGGIRNTFELVPDAPVSKFTLSMQGGQKGLLVNSENICSKPQKALAHFVAQNGKVLNLHPLIANSCSGKQGKKKHKAKAHQRAER